MPRIDRSFGPLRDHLGGRPKHRGLPAHPPRRPGNAVEHRPARSRALRAGKGGGVDAGDDQGAG
jgi:hypothetical protein